MRVSKSDQVQESPYSESPVGSPVDPIAFQLKLTEVFDIWQSALWSSLIFIVKVSTIDLRGFDYSKLATTMI